MATAQDEREGAQAQAQQSPLASQRQGDAPNTGRIAKWFPLSATEGFSQWVSGVRLIRHGEAGLQVLTI
jgi:cardiolipin-specific phospholipase